MKKTIHLSILLLCIAFQEAQAREPYATKSEITVRWGGDDIDYWDNGLGKHHGWSTPLQRYNEGKYTYDDAVCTQAITVSYTGELNRWLALSINASYTGVFQNELFADSDEITDKYRRHRFAIYPMAKFTYLNRPNIRLYSALGFGFGIKTGGWSSDKTKHTDNYVSGQVTFFGVSVGKKLFASWELGYGSMGVLTMGVGYRF